MRLTFMIILFLLIQVAIVWNEALYTDTSFTLEGSNATTTGDNSTEILEFFVDPTNWGSSDFLITLLGISAGIAVAVGLFYIFSKSDTILFISVFSLIVGAGAIPMINLYRVLNNHLNPTICSGTLPCPLAQYLIAFIIGPLSIMYIMAALQWWSGRQT